MNIKEIFEKEGFANIYEWEDAPGASYPKHAHRGKVSLYIVDGSVTFSGGINQELKAGERFDVPAGVAHTALIGPNGCKYIVAEEIKGDS